MCSASCVHSGECGGGVVGDRVCDGCDFCGCGDNCGDESGLGVSYGCNGHGLGNQDSGSVCGNCTGRDHGEVSVVEEVRLVAIALVDLVVEVTAFVDIKAMAKVSVIAWMKVAIMFERG